MVIVFFSEAGALDACEKLIDLHAWPSSKIDAHGWLQNFDVSDRPYAAHMLGQFMFFSDEIVDALFLAAFQGLSNLLRPGWCTREEANQSWNCFLNRAYITVVQGENPNPSDSGFLFARKARQVLGIPECQLIAPHEALKAAAEGFTGPIVFVDDFVGSGEQFLKTWHRKHNIQGHGRMAFSDLSDSASRPIVYCNAILTERGRTRISSDCSSVILATGNIIPEVYNWTSASSLLWPEEERTKGIEFIRRASERLGLGEDGGGQRDWQGFHKLGLGIAFEHSTPDATLPLFHWEEGWHPLVRRS